MISFNMLLHLDGLSSASCMHPAIVNNHHCNTACHLQIVWILCQYFSASIPAALLYSHCEKTRILRNRYGIIAAAAIIRTDDIPLIKQVTQHKLQSAGHDAMPPPTVATPFNLPRTSEWLQNLSLKALYTGSF